MFDQRRFSIIRIPRKERGEKKGFCVRGKSRGKYPLRSDLISPFGKERKGFLKAAMVARTLPTSDSNVGQGSYPEMIFWVLLQRT